VAAEPVLSVRDLVIDFDLPDGPVRVIDGVSFDVFPNEVLCVVGESSSGKSVTMLAVVGLLPRSARVVSGQILFRGRDLRMISAGELRALRGGDLAMVFQDPMTSLNPVLKVGNQIDETLRLHNPELGRAARRKRVVELLRQVEVPNPEARARSYPHEFSGGMRQRAMIAMAMANNPALLIADEPTTALDVTIQAQVLDVLRQVREKRGSALVLITHDLGVVAETADRVVVMYCGRLMETGTVEQIFHDPRHPYTAGLMASLLRMDHEEDEGVYAIPGQPPTPERRPSGCPFHTRCGLMRPPKCVEVVPAMHTGPGHHGVACHYHEEVPAWIARELPQVHAARPTVHP
jgi:oligopeptide/dipeptide ABC transporter ATP-binding protein